MTSDDWDVDSYKKEHENEDHWELRKKFMLAHKDKFTEDELVCLAQVFTNIEFLGCRYPEQTMLRVAELAKGVVEQFREQRKNSIKRTFVAASDAASAKMKGHDREKDKGPPAKKQALTSSIIKKSSDIEIIAIDDQDAPEKTASQTNTRKYGGVKTYNINLNQRNDKVNVDQSSENFVLFLTPGDHPVSEVIRSASINSITPRWDFEQGAGNLKICKLYFNDTLIATGVGENMKNSKENAAIAAIAKLRESNYAIQVKSRFYSDSIVSSSQIKSSQNPTTSNKLKGDSIGAQLMKLMGWAGKGLGKMEQGIEEPVATLSLQIDKRGFGYDNDESPDMVSFRKKTEEFIRVWLEKNLEQDLVFSSEFNSNERKVIHEIAKKYSLKSKSYGKDENRHLVISKKAGPMEIVEALKRSGGSSDKYELLYPTKGN